MFKPMLAPNQDPLSYPEYWQELRYPLLCSPKFDGIRCIVKHNIAMSRSFKPLPSQQVQYNFTMIEDLDGELIEGTATDFDVYNRTQSHIMSENKIGNINYYVFDYTHPDCLDRPFYERLEYADSLIKNHGKYNFHIVNHVLVEDFEELVEYEEDCLSQGFEGIMMRDPVGRYKCGRGTFKEGLIYKLKRFQDAEGVILGFEEQMTNENILEKDELGYAKRSYKKDGMVAANTLGNFIVNYNDMVISVAPGKFNHDLRKTIWNSQSYYIGKTLKFRFFAHGIKDKPRFPRAVGFRSEIDL